MEESDYDRIDMGKNVSKFSEEWVGSIESIFLV